LISFFCISAHLLHNLVKMLVFWHRCFYEDVFFVFSSKKELMICYMYCIALFYNTAHLIKISVTRDPLAIYLSLVFFLAIWNNYAISDIFTNGISILKREKLRKFILGLYSCFYAYISGEKFFLGCDDWIIKKLFTWFSASIYHSFKCPL